MSLFSAVILPHLEKELIGMSPQIAEAVVKIAQSVGSDILAWVQHKMDAKEQESKGEGHG